MYYWFLMGSFLPCLTVHVNLVLIYTPAMPKYVIMHVILIVFP